MEFLHAFLDFFLHIDTHLASILAAYGTLTYGILFLIVFCETGLVVTPFLPGDSLLFAAGAFAAKGSMNIAVLMILLMTAAITGNLLNFFIGRRVGAAAFGWHTRWIRHDYLERTRGFFARHGGMTIVISRFMPIIRTFAPFVAGIGAMPIGRFFVFNLCSGILWVGLFLGAGYFFGTIPFVEKHFSVVILAIIAVSLLPGLVGWLRTRKK